jgi:hypothetical protein
MAVERRTISLNSHAAVLQAELFSIMQLITPESKIMAIRSDELKKATNFLERSPQKETSIHLTYGAWPLYSRKLS